METLLRQRNPFITALNRDLDLDPDDDPPYLDEQSQETLLTSLHQSNASANATYRLAFTLLPVSVILPFVWYLVVARSVRYSVLCLLASTSLGTTAYGMWNVPIPDVDGPGEGNENEGGKEGRVGRNRRTKPSDVFRPDRSSAGGAMSVRDTLSAGFGTDGMGGPLSKALPVLNILICAVLLIASFLVKGRTDAPSEEFWVWLGMPAVMAGICAVVKRAMLDVGRALGGLEGMRFGLKGA